MLNPPTYAVCRPELENPSHEDATELFRTMQVLATDWLEPGDVSEVVRFLALAEARFLTGAAIPVNPGSDQSRMTATSPSAIWRDVFIGAS